MKPTLLKKSLGDLRKRKSRTIFTILTIALGVAALGMFGVIPLFDDAMFNDIEETNMWNVRAGMQNVNLSEEDIQGLGSLKNVESVEPKLIFFSRIYIGERRNDALFIGMTDFNDMKVDKVSLGSGSFPGPLEVLTDLGNSQNGLFMKGIGDDVSVIDANGNVVKLFISGKGRTLTYDQSTYGIAVFFADIGTVRSLSNTSGYNSLSIDLSHATEGKVDEAVQDVKVYLEDNTDFIAFTDMPETRTDNDWPGKEDFADMGSFFYVLTFMTLFCSIFLISNTMHTIITEQRREIAQMKAVGATKLQVAGSYLTTSFFMGVIGSTVGAFLGIWVAFGMVWFLGTSFYGIVPGFSVHFPAILISLSVGIGITLIATLPSLWGALRLNTREGLQDAGISANYGRSMIDRVLLRSRWLPRTAQMGLRNGARKKGRSISTILQVALAVSMFLGIVATGHSLAVAVGDEYDNFQFDIMTQGQMEGGKPLTGSVAYNIEMIDGVEEAEPFAMSAGMVGNSEIYLFGYEHDTIAYNVEGTMWKGRWFTEEDQNSRARVIVVGKAVARTEDISLGDMITIDTATGPVEFEVIGINSGQMMNGHIGYVPLPTVQEILVVDDVVSGFSIITESDDHELIDRVANDIEDDLMARGYVVTNSVLYVMKENNIRSNQQIVNLMIAVGTIIVLITMIGLMSTLTMNILERTREIGMMRCLGSRSSHIRRMFGTEGFVLALLGGLAGVPLGYGVTLFLNWIMLNILNLEMDVLFPMSYVLIALTVTIVLTLVIIQPPLHRAARFRPGDALRYQ
ncbi:MAG: ABC transporter permease [Candidatus Thermoplasmatota archaeon]|nr:ABC transporter permease [Candidatus Thermoplasmatota archaeon]